MQGLQQKGEFESKIISMKKRIGTMILILVLVLLGGYHTIAAQGSPQLPPVVQSSVEFLRDVEPIFHKNCYACHGPSQQMNGFRLDQKEGALKGGYSGAAIQPGIDRWRQNLERGVRLHVCAQEIRPTHQ